MQEPFTTPPNILKTICSFFNPHLIPYLTLSELGCIPKSSDVVVTPKTVVAMSLFEALVSPDGVESVVRLLLENQVASFQFKELIDAIQVPITELLSLRSAKRDTFNSESGAMSKGILKLLGESDILTMIDENRGANWALQGTGTAGVHQFDHPIPKDIKAIVHSATEHDTLNAWDDQAEADRIAISRLIFKSDKRFYEVSKLLQSSRQTIATINRESEWNEQQWLAIQQIISKRASFRTLSTSMGRAALFYSARKPLVTEKYPIPKMNFSLLIKPDNVTVPVQKSFLSGSQLQWGYFHNGVSSGLSVAKDAAHITGGWIAFNQPETLTPQHAGFLLGLGLNGHLKKLEEWHIYNYLGPKHLYTSIALLLGMAASQIGTMNVKSTKVLSVHVEALLPTGSSDLKVPIPVQSAGVVSIGLLYCGSQNRRMTEIFLNELDASKNRKDQDDEDEDEVDKDEGYHLSAGIAMGLINLEKGTMFNGGIIIERLLELAVMTHDVNSAQIMNQSTPGALIAISLMFMRSNLKSIAEKIEIPANEQKYDYIRPDFLHLRALAKNLIMWDNIGKDKQWVESWVPACLKAKVADDRRAMLNSDLLPYYNIISGVCMAMGLKYAGTADETVCDTLLHYLDTLMWLSEEETETTDQAMTRQSCLNNLSSLCMSACSVMAGTGNLDIFRRLRRIYARLSDTINNPAGLQLNNQMAMGILFLGGGQFTFGNGPLALAGLMISFYPLLPEKMSENRFYLQALRHFWSLAAENRCLVVRDAETRAPLSSQVLITTESGSRVVETPALVPEMSMASSIQPISNDFILMKSSGFGQKLTSKSTNEVCKNDFTLWVMKKPLTDNISLETNIDFLVDKEHLDVADKLSEPFGWMTKIKSLDLAEKLNLFELNCKYIIFVVEFHSNYKLTGVRRTLCVSACIKRSFRFEDVLNSTSQAIIEY